MKSAVRNSETPSWKASAGWKTPIEIGARLRRAISDALFPGKCHACRSPIPAGSRPMASGDDSVAGLPTDEMFGRLMRGFLCPACAADFTPVGSPLCSRCGQPFESRADADHLCSDCISRKKHFSRARSCGVYAGTLLNLIHAYKYQGRTGLAKPFGELLYLEFLRHYGNAGIDIVLPVPLHARRLRSRGFNQALLMIRRWPKMAVSPGRSPGRRFHINAGTLIRPKNTAAQTGLDRRARIKNTSNAFSVTRAARITGKNVLLVDDVFTTGSTAEECARVLVRAGAASVSVLTLARAV